MTEQEWLECTIPNEMLEFLPARSSDRKKRLFAVAFCRTIWERLSDERSRIAIEIVERLADGDASMEELSIARANAETVESEVARTDWPIARAAAVAALDDSGEAAFFVVRAMVFDEKWISAGETQACLLREIFGALPFRHTAIEPSLLKWNDGTVFKLAQTIYEQKTFDSMPILADALEEAGCADADILNHCRGAGPHVRGCWVVDLILGKQ